MKDVFCYEGCRNNRGRAAVAPKDCSWCIRHVQFSIFALKSFGYAETEGWKTDFFEGRERDCFVLGFKNQVESCLKGRVRGEDGTGCLPITQPCRPWGGIVAWESVWFVEHLRPTSTGIKCRIVSFFPCFCGVWGCCRVLG